MFFVIITVPGTYVPTVITKTDFSFSKNADKFENILRDYQKSNGEGTERNIRNVGDVGDDRCVLFLFALIEYNRPYDTGRDDRIKAITIQGV